MTSRHTHVMSNAFISSLHQAAKQSALRSCSEGKKIETVREFKKNGKCKRCGAGLEQRRWPFDAQHLTFGTSGTETQSVLGSRMKRREDEIDVNS